MDPDFFMLIQLIPIILGVLLIIGFIKTFPIKLGRKHQYSIIEKLITGKNQGVSRNFIFERIELPAELINFFNREKIKLLEQKIKLFYSLNFLLTLIPVITIVLIIVLVIIFLADQKLTISIINNLLNKSPDDEININIDFLNYILIFMIGLPLVIKWILKFASEFFSLTKLSKKIIIDYSTNEFKIVSENNTPLINFYLNDPDYKIEVANDIKKLGILIPFYLKRNDKIEYIIIISKLSLPINLALNLTKPQK